MDMPFRRMGRSGLRLSTFSIGSWVTYGGTVDEGRAHACLSAAVDHGVNFIDNAEAYAAGAAEEVVGRWLASQRREDLVVSSKVFWGGEGPNDRGLNRKHVVEACHAALRRLGTDYLDLYFCHRPDPDTPVLETVRTMNRLMDQGKILYWGTSEWTPDQLAEAYAVCDANGLEGPAVEQPQYNMFHRARVEVELGGLVQRRGLGTTTWSPLASGLLTGKYNDGVPADSRLAHPSYQWLQSERTAERIARVRALSVVAGDLGCSVAQLALAWCARHPHVSTVITGASRPGQVAENMGAIDVLDKLTPAVLARIDEVLGNKPRPPT
jgi:voltage-dependent potassium channel beta subunit